MSELREMLSEVVASAEKDTGLAGAADAEREDTAAAPPSEEGGGDTQQAAPDDTAPELTSEPKGEASGKEEKGQEELLTPAPGDKNVPPAKSPTPAPAATPAAVIRAPASMKPEARALWDKVPPEIQAEVHRREREVNETLRSSAESRKFHEEFRQTVGPFEAMIRAEGSEPLRAVENLLQTAAALRTASAPVKAKMVADIVRDFGIDIRMLDSAISGTLPPPGPEPQYVQQIQQQLAPLTEFVQQFRGQAAAVRAKTEAEAQHEIDEFFSDEDNFPYANDLREEIADILEVSARRGVKMGLRDAYARATMLHPTISKLVENKGVAQQVAQQNAAAQRARNAAASVRSAPSGSGNDDGDDDDSIRGALNRSITKVSGKV